MIRLLLVVEMSNARDQRRVSLLLCPSNCLFLGLAGVQNMIGVIFDDIVVDMAALRTPFRSSFNVNICHELLSPSSLGSLPDFTTTLAGGKAASMGFTIGAIVCLASTRDLPQGRGRRNRPVIFAGGLQPTVDCVLRVLDGFEFGFAVRHAAGKIRHDREKAAAIRLGKLLNFDVVNWSLAHVLSQSRKKATSFLIYIGLIGRLKGMVKISFLPDLEIL